MTSVSTAQTSDVGAISADSATSLLSPTKSERSSRVW